MATPLDRLFAKLPGAWSVKRTITDSRMGEGRFQGRALFTPQADAALIYAECGELVMSGWRGPAYRRWLYRLEPAALSILYPDGETLLHRFAFGGGARCAEHTHLCGEDRYSAQIALTGADFTLSYTVNGPRKRYVLNTTYVHLGNREHRCSKSIDPAGEAGDCL